MVENQNEISNPYESTAFKEDKKKKLKQLQQNRFQTEVLPTATIAQDMQNLRISTPSEDLSPSLVMVPDDMKYIKVNMSDKNQIGQTSKPHELLNQDSVRRGNPLSYLTDSLEVPP